MRALLCLMACLASSKLHVLHCFCVLLLTRACLHLYLHLCIKDFQAAQDWAVPLS